MTISLELSNIQLHGSAANKADAIRQVGSLLVNSGTIQPGYIDSMFGREKVANTYLGNSISIPHGLPKDRAMINKTGIAVLQVPQGVTWNPGETVRLVVGIAAKSDEHLQILANLVHVLNDEALVERLVTTNDPNDILLALTGQAVPSAAPAAVEAQPSDFPKYVDLVVSNATGLHARPATYFVTLAKEFVSEVRVRHGSKVANGKSLASLLGLGAEHGVTIRVMAQGPDEDAALAALRQAVEANLGEEEEEGVMPEALLAGFVWQPVSTAGVVPGIAASPGLAIGPLALYKRSKIVVERTAKDPARETTHLFEAIEAGKAQLWDLYAEVKERSGAGQAAIFLAHREFLDDPEMIDEAKALIEQGHSAGWAWQQTFERRAAEMARLDDPVLAGRAVDLGDVGNRVLRYLAAQLDDAPALPDQPVILLAEDLTPSDTASLDPALVLGFVTAGGGPTSHTAIIARALGIPATVGAGPAALHQIEGVLAILDGHSGNLYVEPSEADLASARQAQQDLQALREAENLTRYEPAITTDGHRVEVVANVSRPSEAEQAVNAGAEGIGLMRTEFLFLERDQPPTEEEQYEAYRVMVEALNGLPLIIRTLDIGGDKNVPYLNLPPEDNSFLGVRGIRLCLARPGLFKPQLRAIFRAAQHGPVKIMFPMIATLEDIQAAKAVTEEVRLEVGADPVEIGIMIEVPSAVIMADELAEEVHFFSIGTNDLTQYVLAMDRVHPVLAKQADGLHPAVLRMVGRTVQAANAAGRWVGVCGGIAGDPRGALILVGLGVTELSVSIPSVAAVKAQMRRVSLADMDALAKRALACRTAAEVRALPLP